MWTRRWQKKSFPLGLCPLSSLDLIKTVEAPAPINSASLHPEKDFFVAGGEDFKLYKFDYSTKEELGET